MAAVLLDQPYSTVPTPAAATRPAANRQPRPRPARRLASAIHRRRRLLAVLIGLGLVLTVARAGAALEGGSLATPERLPHVRTIVVQPGDSLWSIAHELAPEHDPRSVVDAMVEARGTSTLAPGETVTWLENQAPEHTDNSQTPAVRWLCALSVLPRERRQGRRLAPGGGPARDPAPARVPGVRPAVHHLRTGRGVAGGGAQAVGRDRAVRRGEAACRYRARGDRPARRRGDRHARRRDRGGAPGRRGPRSRSDRIGMAVLERLRAARPGRRTCASRRSTRASRTSPTSSARSASSRRSRRRNAAEQGRLRKSPERRLGNR